MLQLEIYQPLCLIPKLNRFLYFLILSNQIIYMLLRCLVIIDCIYL